MSDEGICEGDLRLLADFDCPAEELSEMSISDKKDLIKTIRLSLTQSVSPKHEEAAMPMLDEYQQRLQSTGVTVTRVGAASRNNDGDQEVVFLKEIASSPSNSLARPPIRSPSPVGCINQTTPVRKNTPTASISGTAGTRKKVVWLKPTKEQVVSPKRPESNVQRETMPSQDFRSQSFRAEIYALDPFSCTNTELSTLAETSSLPKRERTSVPFYYSVHALSLKTDDYVALCCRKFGCVRVPLITDKVEEIAKETPKDFDPCNASDEVLDFPLFSEESSAKYNLRQRSATKRTANNFEFVFTDDEDSDSIVPNKKVNRNETDATFSPKEETKAPTTKTRANKLSLAASKSAAERLAKASMELKIVDSDDSSNSDVPGKEVYAPKLDYSAIVSNEPSKWKMSKSRVSAQPKGQATMDDTLATMAGKETGKPRQMRAKPSDVIKPVPVSGKNRRAELSTSRKPARGKQAYKKSEDDDNEDQEKQDALLSCPICKEEFPNTQIEAHVNACCDESVTKSEEGECPICFKNFQQHELENHSFSCNGITESLVMDED